MPAANAVGSQNVTILSILGFEYIPDNGFNIVVVIQNLAARAGVPVLETREVIVSESTLHPNSAWVTKQAEAFVDEIKNREQKPSIVMHDKDTKFTKDFVQKLKDNGIRTNALPKASPNLNGRCERFIQTIKLECLAKLILFSKKHLDPFGSVELT